MKDERTKGKYVSENCNDPDSLAYGEIGLLGQQFERFFTVVPRSNRLLICYDDLESDSESVYKKVVEFLRLEIDYDGSFEAINRSMAHKSDLVGHVVNHLGYIKKLFGIDNGFGVLNTITRWNRKEKLRPTLEPQLRTEMIDYFKCDIRKLEILLDRDLSHWVNG